MVRSIIFFMFSLCLLAILPGSAAESVKAPAVQTDCTPESYKASGCAFTLNPHHALVAGTLNPQFTITYRNPQGSVRHRTYQANIKLMGLNAELSVRPSFAFFVGNVNFANSDAVIELGKGVEVSLPFLTNMLTNKMPKKYRPDIDWINFSYAPIRRKLRTTWNNITEKEHYVYLQTGNNTSNFESNTYLGIESLYDSVLSYLRVAGLTITACPCKNVPGVLVIISMPLGVSCGMMSLVRGGTLTPVY